LHSAKCILYSLDMSVVAGLQHEGLWAEAGEVLADAARSLHLAGAEVILLCTNTMHKVAQRVEEATPAPFLHIVDPTAEQINLAGLRRVALLGTRFTMQESFFATVCANFTA